MILYKLKTLFTIVKVTVVSLDFMTVYILFIRNTKISTNPILDILSRLIIQ